MNRKRRTTEEIVNKLRHADVELAKGHSIASTSKLIGIISAEIRLIKRQKEEYGKAVKALFEEDIACVALWSSWILHSEMPDWCILI
jgi:hypothetical protein